MVNIQLVELWCLQEIDLFEGDAPISPSTEKTGLLVEANVGIFDSQLLL